MNKNNLKAIFFDMDGVIYDSMGNHATAWSRAFEHLGIPFPAEMVYMNEGRTGASTINMAFHENKDRSATAQEIKTIYSKKSEIFEHLPKVGLIPGIRDFMENVKQNGLDIWVVTGSGQERLLDGLVKDFCGLVDRNKIVSGLDVKHGKPNPEPYLMALQKSGFHANEVVVVENAPLGVESAKAAGIFTIAVNTGILPNKILSDSGADLVLKDMKQLSELFWT